MKITGFETPLRFGELTGNLIRGSNDDRAPLVFMPGLTFDRTMWIPVLRSIHEMDPG